MDWEIQISESAVILVIELHVYLFVCDVNEAWPIFLICMEWKQLHHKKWKFFACFFRSSFSSRLCHSYHKLGSIKATQRNPRAQSEVRFDTWNNGSRAEKFTLPHSFVPSHTLTSYALMHMCACVCIRWNEHGHMHVGFVLLSHSLHGSLRSVVSK